MAIGIDVVKVDRIEKLIEKKEFVDRVFTEKEVESVTNLKNKAESYSGKFAVKESITKALGTGIGNVGFKDIEVLKDEYGKPFVILSNHAHGLWNDKFKNQPEVSITHDGGYAIAVVHGNERDDIIMEISQDIMGLVKKRELFTNKGNYGKVAIVGGSSGMAGSVFMSSIAALRSGSGLVYTIVPKSIQQVMEIKSLENIVVAIDGSKDYFTRNSASKIINKVRDCDVVAIGPGLGGFDGDVEFMDTILSKVDKPMVIDADGINIIAKGNIVNLSRGSCDIVITPHPGEMARIIGATVKYVNSNRISSAVDVAKVLNCIVVLKGHNTVVTDGTQVYINNTGNPGMATAGSGDVLTGIIASLLGMGYDGFTSGKLGTYIHGLAGDIKAKVIGEDGIIARDIIDGIPLAIKMIKEKNNG